MRCPNRGPLGAIATEQRCERRSGAVWRIQWARLNKTLLRAYVKPPFTRGHFVNPPYCLWETAKLRLYSSPAKSTSVLIKAEFGRRFSKLFV